MTLKSMTGFGRSSGVHGETSWHWEVRSVNGRGLELRFRMPSGLEGLEIKARSLAQEALARGNCTLNLMLRRETGELAIRLNEAALVQALAAAERAQALTHKEALNLDTLLAMRGVVEVVEGEESEEAHAKLEAALLTGLGTALDQLVAARMAEGARLGGVMTNQLVQIASLVERVSNATARQPETIRQRCTNVASWFTPKLRTVLYDSPSARTVVVSVVGGPTPEITSDAWKSCSGGAVPLGSSVDP